MFQGIKELKPHFFRHNCKNCHRAGLVKCTMCEGNGLMGRTRLDARESMVITAGMGGGTGASSYRCHFCKGKGTEVCGPCQGQGWSYQPHVNERKFQPMPVFEDFHRTQAEKLFGPDPVKKKTRQRKKFFEKFDKQKEADEEREDEERRLRKERKRLKKLEKGGGKKDKKDKGKDKKDKKKDKNKA